MKSYWNDLEYFAFNEGRLSSPDLKDSCDYLSQNLMYRMDCLRGALQVPFRVNSGYRTPEYNRKIHGAERSQHVLGNALDISTVGWSNEKRIEAVIVARRIGFKGIGIYPTFLHFDVRKTAPAAWRSVNGKLLPVAVGDEALYV